MIYLYSGTPGSGKSLHQAKDIYHHLKFGNPVIANFEINTALFKKKVPFIYLPNNELNPKELIEISHTYFSNHKFKEGAIKLYIDECQILFNAREWSKPDRQDWLIFFTQHRKYGYNIFLVAQFDRMIDKQIRSLIEYEVIHRKVENFGSWGIFFNLLALGHLFCAVTYWYPMKERIDSEFFKAHKKYFNLYNTYDVFNKTLEGGGAVNSNVQLAIKK